MKTCPYCGEKIQDAAVKCKFCGEWLEDNNKRKGNSSFDFQRWQWIFYGLGRLMGAMNLLFRLIMAIAHSNDKEGQFFNKAFHKRVYIRGLVMTILAITVFVISMLSTSVMYLGGQ